MRLVIIGDLDGHLSAAGKIAMARGAKVETAESTDAALAILRMRGADLVMVDLSHDIARFVSGLQTERIHVAVIACGASGTAPERASATIAAGAQEFINLPPDPDLIAGLLQMVSADDDDGILCTDPQMVEIMSLAKRFAGSEASILITGASGTGKEVMARYIHTNSPRAEGRFVAINCAAIPENLLESELFGHERGAFSGAVARRLGKFEEAHNGTLLLDEITEMDVRLQAKLLRAIQQKEIDRLGGSAPVKVNVRIIATSNRNVAEAVAAGMFREDLYYRLNVVRLELPPLGERPADIASLARHFAEKYADANRITRRPLSAEALQMLQDYSWPGNVRQLENTLHRAVLLAEGEHIGAETIVLDAVPQSSESFHTRTLEEAERELIEGTMQHCQGDTSHAARLLGINVRLLNKKLDALASGEDASALPPASPAQ